MNRLYVEPCKEKLFYEDSSYERTKIRHQINIRLKTVRVIAGSFLKIGASILMILLMLEATRNIANLLLVSFVYQYIFNKYHLPISTLNLSELLKRDKPYILYLRGFKTDLYKEQSYTEMSNEKFSNFSEYWFFDVLGNSIKDKDTDFICVGMTKELECPMGCKRVYLDDNNWKNDVQTLIQNAKHIYILINSNDSCIWEIQQSISVKEKVTYVIDDMNEFLNAINQISIQMPIIEDLAGKIAFVKIQNSGINVSYTENSINGYAKYFNIKRTYKTKKLIRTLLHQSIILLIILVTVIIIEMFLILSGITDSF